jgi:hypothetical protein
MRYLPGFELVSHWDCRACWCCLLRGTDSAIWSKTGTESVTRGEMSRLRLLSAQMSGVFPQYPRRHASFILNDGGLERINHSSAQIVGGLRQQSFVYQVPFRAIGQ